MKTRDMPVSYQDFVLSNQYFGTPMPTDPTMKMELTPIVYQNMRTIGARPSRLQQGLRAVGRGLAIAGGAGVAVGVANSLFNKPSDNYAQSVTNNQTTGGRNTRVGQLDSFDQFFETDNEKYAKTGGLGESSPPSKSTTPAQTVSITDKVENFIGPHPVGTETRKDLKYLNNVRSRFSRMQAQGFSSGLRNEDQEANIAAARSGEYQVSDKDAADIAAAENMPASPTVQADETARKMRQRQHIENSQMLPYDSPLRSTFGGKTNPPEETTLMDMMSDDTPVTDKVVSFINKTKKGLPEKKTPKVSDLGERRDDNALVSMKTLIAAGEKEDEQAIMQTPDVDLSEIENDSALADIGRREDPQDVSPRGVIPPDKSGTINKTDLSTIGDIIGEKQADNPIVGGLQGIGKAARIAGKLGKRTVEELADKGAKDRRSYAKYKETVRKAKAFKKIAEDRENTNDSE